jgi:hypothetical protein
MPSLWIAGPRGLVPLEVEGYATEGDFQKLLADNPAVLASALDGGDETGGWLFIAQELAIKAESSDVGTWKLDHLFIASDGRPVLVEVKRSSNPQARREVVGQMLDYAASFALDWTAERLRGRWEQRFGPQDVEARVEEMAEFLAPTDRDEEQFWGDVQTKIDAGELRLLFVADELSPTLVRIIEYLNGQLRNAEVLGVEVLRHSAVHGPVAYQPVVRGLSTPTGRRKSTPERRTKDEFDEVLLVHHPQEVLDGVNELIKRAETLGGWPSIGRGANNPALYINFRTNGGLPKYWPLLIGPVRGKLVVRVVKLRGHPAFEDPEVREELLARVAAATGSPIQGNTDGMPWVPLAAIAKPGVVDKLADVLTWVVATADGGRT